jgi:hypothetical protein
MDYFKDAIAVCPKQATEEVTEKFWFQKEPKVYTHIVSGESFQGFSEGDQNFENSGYQ